MVAGVLAVLLLLFAVVEALDVPVLTDPAPLCSGSAWDDAAGRC